MNSTSGGRRLVLSTCKIAESNCNIVAHQGDSHPSQDVRNIMLLGEHGGGDDEHGPQCYDWLNTRTYPPPQQHK